jgi:hypothetical protein
MHYVWSRSLSGLRTVTFSKMSDRLLILRGLVYTSMLSFAAVVCLTQTLDALNATPGQR